MYIDVECLEAYNVLNFAEKQKLRDLCVCLLAETTSGLCVVEKSCISEFDFELRIIQDEISDICTTYALPTNIQERICAYRKENI